MTSEGIRARPAGANGGTPSGGASTSAAAPGAANGAPNAANGANGETAIADCASCPLGAAADVEHGGRCPMVDRRRRAGACLYVAGEPAERVWFIKRGTVVLSREADERRGEGVPWAIRTAGGLLGAEGLVHPSYLDTAHCVTEVIACSAARADIESWLATRAAAPGAMLGCVLRAQCSDAPRRAGADGNAVRRVARWLLEGPKRRRSAALPRRVVAGMLGMQPETLSRALATIAARHAIEVTRRWVDVLDVAALERIATGELR